MSGISNHLYNELMKAMKDAPIRESIVRQEPIVRRWIEDSIERADVDTTAELLEDLITANEYYEGSRPVFNQVIDFMLELDANDIPRDSSAFSGQVRRAGEYGSLDTFFVSGDEVIPVDSPDRTPSMINEAEDLKPEQHPLFESWNSAVDRFKEAEASNDQFGMDSAQRMLDRLEKLIIAEPAKPVPVPVPSPATSAPAPHADPEYDGAGHRDTHDDLQRRIDALPDNPTPESERELDSINAAIDKLDSALDVSYDEDYTDYG